MAGVEHSLTFKLASQLSSTFPQAFRFAGGTIQELSATMASLEAEASKTGAFLKQRKAVKGALSTYQEAKKKLDALESSISQVGVPTKKMAAAHLKASEAVKQCEVKLEHEKRVLKGLPVDARAASKTIEALEESQKSLAGQIDETKEKIKRQQNAFKNFDAASGKITMAIGSFRAVGGAVSSVKSAIEGPVQASMKMEDAMADLAKVSDFTPEGLAEMQRKLEKMSLTIPMSADGLAQIAAAAAGAGVAQDELLGFTEQAAKMAVAFDMTAEQAGTMMAKWQSGMKLTMSQTYALADAVNGLSNNNAALANQIGDTVQRYGALGKVAGLSEKQTAALAASLIASGASIETAATGMKAFMGTLAKGAQLSERQQAALANIGIPDVKQLQKDLQKDAAGTIVKVLEGLNGLSEERRTMYLNVLFGETGSEALGRLLQNLDAVKKNFDYVADEANTAGSMEKEFEARSKTTSNSLVLLKNSADYVARAFGDQFLGPIRRTALYMGDLAEVAGSWVRENSALVKSVLKCAAVLGGLVTAGIALKGVMYAASAVMDVWRGLCVFSSLAMKTTMVVGNALAMTGRLIGGAFSFAGKTLKGIAWGASRVAMLAWRAACVATSTAIEASTVLIKLFGGALWFAFTNPVGLAVTALAGLVAGGVALYKNFDVVKEKVDALQTAFTQKFPGISKVVQLAFSGIQKNFVMGQEKFEQLVGWIDGIFLTKWGSVWQRVQDSFAQIFGGLSGLIKAPINSVIGLVNDALSKLNGLSIELPTMLGGGTVGFNIPEIPQLADGGVVSSPTLAMIGEGREPEAVMPLSKLDAATSSSSTVVNFSPVINVTGGSADTYADVKRALDEGRRSFEREFDQLMRNRSRLSFA